MIEVFKKLWGFIREGKLGRCGCDSIAPALSKMTATQKDLRKRLSKAEATLNGEDGWHRLDTLKKNTNGGAA